MQCVLGVVMKYLLLAGAFLGVIGYAWMSAGDPNVYPMSQAEAYAKLTSARIPANNGSILGSHPYAVSGDGVSTVNWNASGTSSSTHCEADITAEGASKSRITAFCSGGGASDGAAAGMLSGMQRKALIEHIDSTLKGRAFDARMANGETAARWPSDARQPDGSYGTMVAGALKMDHDMHQMQRDADAATVAMENGGGAPNRYSASKPMVDLSSTSH